jgi:hypothetical protein
MKHVSQYLTHSPWQAFLSRRLGTMVIRYTEKVNNLLYSLHAHVLSSIEREGYNLIQGIYHYPSLCGCGDSIKFSDRNR